MSGAVAQANALRWLPSRAEPGFKRCFPPDIIGGSTLAIDRRQIKQVQKRGHQILRWVKIADLQKRIDALTGKDEGNDDDARVAKLQDEHHQQRGVAWRGVARSEPLNPLGPSGNFWPANRCRSTWLAGSAGAGGGEGVSGGGLRTPKPLWA